MAPRRDKAEAVFGWALDIIQRRAAKLRSWGEVKRRPWLLCSWAWSLGIVLVVALVGLLALLCCDIQHDSPRSAWFDDR